MWSKVVSTRWGGSGSQGVDIFRWFPFFLVRSLPPWDPVSKFHSKHLAVGSQFPIPTQFHIQSCAAAPELSSYPVHNDNECRRLWTL